MQIAVIYSLLLERLCQAFRGLNKLHEPKGGGRTKPWHIKQQGSKISPKSHFDRFTCCGCRLTSELEVLFHQQPSCSCPGCGVVAVPPRREPDRRGGIVPVLTPVILSALTFRLSSASTPQPARTSPLTASDCCLAAWPYTNTIQTDSPPQLHHCLLLIQEIDSHMKLSPCSTFITGWHILTDSQPHSGES